MLLAIGVFLVVTGVAMGLGWALSSIPGNMAKRRLEKRLREVGSLSLMQDGEAASVVRQDEQGPLPSVEKLLGKTGAGLSLTRLIEQSGVRATSGGILVVSGGLALVGMLAVLMFAPSASFAPIGFLLGAAPILFLMQRRGARIKKFEEQFPEALDLITRAMRAGHSLTFGFQMVGDELPDPIGSEFAQVAEEIKLGRELRVALANLVYRVEAGDLPFFITAITIQRETGGNLAEVLEKLSALIRERFALYGKVRALTAIGKASANLLASMPLVLVGLLYTCGGDGGRSYVEPLYTTAPGMMLAAGAAGLVVIGYILCRRMAQIEV